MRLVLQATLRTGRAVPLEYAEYLLCVKLGKLPHELGEMEERDFELFLRFMREEAEADRLRALRSQHYAQQ